MLMRIFYLLPVIELFRKDFEREYLEFEPLQQPPGPKKNKKISLALAVDEINADNEIIPKENITENVPAEPKEALEEDKKCNEYSVFKFRLKGFFIAGRNAKREEEEENRIKLLNEQHQEETKKYKEENSQLRNELQELMNRVQELSKENAQIKQEVEYFSQYQSHINPKIERKGSPEFFTKG